MNTNQVSVNFSTPFSSEEKKEVLKFNPPLPKGIDREEVIGIARRSIHNGLDLSTFNLDNLRYLMVLSTKKTLTEQDAIKKGYESKKDYLQKLRKNCARERLLFKHAAIFQKWILKTEFNGVFPTQNS